MRDWPGARRQPAALVEQVEQMDSMRTEQSGNSTKLQAILAVASQSMYGW